jgi:hypothetical protein
MTTGTQQANAAGHGRHEDDDGQVGQEQLDLLIYHLAPFP